MEKIDIVNKVLVKIEKWFSMPKLNIVKTIYFNFRTMPLNVAIKLPVFIYGKVQLGNLSGNVVFQNCEVKRGMIKLGRCIDMFYPKGRSLIVIGEKGKLIFEGMCLINTRFTLRVTKNASLILGNNVRIGSNVRICSQQEIRIGSNTGIAYSCEIMDSNFHYVLDKENNRVHRYTSPVYIGESNWIGNNSQIMKGTRTKDYTMVAARSFLNKDYIKAYSLDYEYGILVGMPAKLKSTGQQRIFSIEIENRLNNYFGEHPEDYYVDFDALN